MQSNAPKAMKIPGWFLGDKFVPTHQYKRISKVLCFSQKKQHLSKLWLQSCLLILLWQIHTIFYRNYKHENYEAQLIVEEI